MQVVAETADVVDSDLVAERLEDVQVGMSTPLDARMVAQELGGEEQREVALADT